LNFINDKALSWLIPNYEPFKNGAFTREARQCLELLRGPVMVDVKKIESTARKKFYIQSSKLDKIIKNKMSTNPEHGIEFLLAQKMFYLEMQLFLDKLIDKLNAEQ